MNLTEVEKAGGMQKYLEKKEAARVKNDHEARLPNDVECLACHEMVVEANIRSLYTKKGVVTVCGNCESEAMQGKKLKFSKARDESKGSKKGKGKGGEGGPEPVGGKE